MQKVLIVYESEYGTTEKTAKYLSLILGPARYTRTSALPDYYKDFDFIVIGSPIYNGKIHPKITSFINENLDWIKKKKIALFTISLSLKDGNENLIGLEKCLDHVLVKKALGGKLKLNNLKNNDTQSLNEFSAQSGFKLEDMDIYNLEDVIRFALEIKSIKEDLIPKVPQKELEVMVREFLKEHNTCTLSTSYNQRVRSTPIEYNYFNGNIYLLSEGGEKFANILLNNKVSIAVYEDYTSMNNLAGMQITGIASLVENKEEYMDIIKMKGLNPDFIDKLPVHMNLIKIEIEKIEFLYSKFQKMGYGPKQILRY